jgi:hypothetical protein
MSDQDGYDPARVADQLAALNSHMLRLNNTLEAINNNLVGIGERIELAGSDQQPLRGRRITSLTEFTTLATDTPEG